MSYGQNRKQRTSIVPLYEARRLLRQALPGVKSPNSRERLLRTLSLISIVIEEEAAFQRGSIELPKINSSTT